MVNPAEVDAVILVGGKGTRLRPLTLSAPKPMLPTAGLPFLTHLLSRIADAGIEHVVLGTSYKAAVFESEFGDGSKLGLQIDYVVEDEPLGTGGGIANVASRLRHDTAVVFNGDVLSGCDLRALLDSHSTQDADVTLHLVRVGDPRAFGCVPTDADGVVTAFLEKTQDPPTDQINAGCYVFKRAVIDAHPEGAGAVGGARGVPRSAGRRAAGVRLRRLHLLARHGHAGGLRPRLGRPGPRHRAVAGAAGPARRDRWCTTGRRVAPGALLIGGTVVGRGAEIAGGARLDGAVIFDGVRVEAGAVIERSIIGFGARIGPRALIRDGVIGDGADIGARCELLRGARVWPGVAIPDGGIRFSTDV